MVDQPAKILAIKLRAIGDTVIWTASLQALREAFPRAEIHVLTYVTNAPVLEEHGAVNVKHFLYSRNRLHLLRRLWSLRRQHFDLLLGFHATTSLCRWAWLAGAMKMALHHHSRQMTPKGSVEILHPGQLEDAITRDLRVLEAVGVTGGRPATRIWLTPSESEFAELRVRTEIARSGGDVNLPRYLFLPGAGHHLRRYPKDLWLPLVEKVLREKRYQPVVVVDQPLSREWGLREECGRRNIPLLDTGGLRDFVGLVSRGTRALANDSGPGHIAVALGLKTTFVFGPGCVGDWHPYDRTEHPLLRVAVPCRGQGPRDQEQFQYCTVDECSHHRCMRELPAVPE